MSHAPQRDMTSWPVAKCRGTEVEHWSLHVNEMRVLLTESSDESARRGSASTIFACVVSSGSSVKESAAPAAVRRMLSPVREAQALRATGAGEGVREYLAPSVGTAGAVLCFRRT